MGYRRKKQTPGPLARCCAPVKLYCDHLRLRLHGALSAYVSKRKLLFQNIWINAEVVDRLFGQIEKEKQDLENHEEESDEEEEPIELTSSHYIKLLKILFYCVLCIVLVTGTLHVINESPRDKEGNLQLDQFIGLKNGTFLSWKAELVDPHINKLTNLTKEHLNKTKYTLLEQQLLLEHLAKQHERGIANMTRPFREQVSRDIRQNIRNLHTPEGRAKLSQVVSGNLESLAALTVDAKDKVVSTALPMLPRSAKDVHQATDKLASQLGQLTAEKGEGLKGFQYAISKFYVTDESSYKHCTEAIDFCAAGSGKACSSYLPARHTLGPRPDQRLFFVNIPPDMNSTATNYLATLLRLGGCPPQDCPVFFNHMKHYQTDQHALLYTDDGFTLISREFAEFNDLAEAVDHPAKYAAGMMTMLRSPGRRIAQQFKHDTLSDARRTSCATTVDEMAQCCKQGRTEMQSRTCTKYNNFQSATLLGRPWAEVPEDKRWEAYQQISEKMAGMWFVGIDEAFTASMCLFMWQFKFDAQFEQDCMRNDVKALPALAEAVRDMRLNQEDITVTKNRQGDTPDLGSGAEEFKKKYNYEFIGSDARDFIQYDWEVYGEASKLFWRRLTSVYQSHGLKIQCEYSQNAWSKNAR